MRIINRVEKIKLSTLWMQIISVILILVSYMTSRSIVFVAGALCFLFLLSNVGWEQKYSLMFFLFSFSNIFKYNMEQTSVFMLLRISIILSIIIYDSKKLSMELIVKCIVLLMYMIAISVDTSSEGLKHCLNIVLWLIIGYFMQSTIDSDNVLPISRSFSNGVILSSFIGMNVSFIPELFEEMASNEIIGIDGGSINRFAGLFNDPNMYTILIVVALWSLYYEFSRGKLSVSEYGIRSLLITFFGLMTMSKSCVILVVLYWLYIVFSINSIKILPKFVIVIAIAAFAVYFVAKNPEWIVNLFERFTGRKRSGYVTANDVTTGRVEIWGWYLDYLYDSNTWLWGNGLGSLLPKGRAAHNTILQLLFVVGFVGTMFVYYFLKYMYKATPSGKKVVGVNKGGIYCLLYIMATLFFLDGLYIEIYYYMIPICFIYMKKFETADVNT